MDGANQDPLGASFLFVWLDAICYTVTEDGHYISKAFYKEKRE